MRIAVGVDLHSKMAVAHAVLASNREPKRNEKEFLDFFNKEFSDVPSTPENMKRTGS